MNQPSHKLYLIISLTFFLLAFLFHASDIRLRNETSASQIAPHVLRFHIMANSDAAEDQDIKLEIRSLVLDYMKKNLADTADKEETAQWLTTHQSQIEHLANAHLNKRGFDYTSHLELTNCYFPTRNYDGLVFPCGNYDAARIILGKGKGHNWWCVLYPRYCFLEETWSLEKQDDALLSEEHRPVIKIRLKLFDIFKRTKQRHTD